VSQDVDEEEPILRGGADMVVGDRVVDTLPVAARGRIQ